MAQHKNNTSSRTVWCHQCPSNDQMLVHCWPTVCDTGPTLIQYWVNLCVSCQMSNNVEKLTQCWLNVGSKSKTLTQHEANIGTSSRVRWGTTTTASPAQAQRFMSRTHFQKMRQSIRGEAGWKVMRPWPGLPRDSHRPITRRLYDHVTATTVA